MSFYGVTERIQLERGDIGGRLALAFFVSFLLGLGHLLIGTDPMLSFAAFLIVILAFTPLCLFGVFHFGAVLVFILLFRHGVFVIVAKLVQGAPLQNNLYAPNEAYLMLLTGAAGYVTAVLISSFVFTGRAILPEFPRTRFLGFLSVVTALAGTLAWGGLWLRISTEASLPGQDQGITVAVFFRGLFLMSIIAGTAKVIMESRGHRSINLWVVSLLALQTIFGFVSNSKMMAVLGVIAWLFTSFFFRGRVSLKHVMVILFAAVMLMEVITPAFHYVRAVRGDLGGLERIEYTAEVLLRTVTSTEFMGFLLEREKFAAADSYLVYFENSSQILERFALVQNIDAIIPGIDANGQMGAGHLLRGFPMSLPRFLNPDKNVISSGDLVTWHTGLRPWELAGNPTVPLIADAYAAVGWSGVALAPLIFFSVILTVFSFLAGRSLFRNVWLVYFLVTYSNLLTEVGADGLSVFLLRHLPMDAVFFLLVMAAYRVIYREDMMGRQSDEAERPFS